MSVIATIMNIHPIMGIHLPPLARLEMARPASSFSSVASAKIRQGHTTYCSIEPVIHHRIDERPMPEPTAPKNLYDIIPDARDGLTRTERIILYVLDQTQRERNGRNVPTAMLYGRVLEYVDLSEAELQACLNRWVSR